MSDVDDPAALGIHSSRRDYDLADELDVGSAERLKALADPLRMRIADLVLERAMSVTELAERVRRPKGTVAYHVDVLVDAGLLQVVRTRKVRAVEERFYGRVARTYVFPDSETGVPFLREFLGEIDLDRYTDRNDRPGIGLATLRHARIPAERVDDYRRRLLALAVEFVDEPRDGDTEFGLYIALYPTNREHQTGAASS